MLKIIRNIVVLVFIVGLTLAVTLSSGFKPLPAPPQPQRQPAPINTSNHLPEQMASEIAEQIMQQVVKYYDHHQRFPTAEGFWEQMHDYIDVPLHNPINGSDSVIAMTRDVDAHAVGWVYDETSGAVYPGAVFNGNHSLLSTPSR